MKECAEEVQCPFSKSRLRGFTGRLDSSIDARTSITNAIALAPGALFAPLDKLGASTQPHIGAALPAHAHGSFTAGQRLLPAVGEPPGAKTKSKSGGRAAQSEAALAEVSALKAEIAGIEALLGHLKHALPAKGHSSVRLETEDHLRSRAQSHQHRIHELHGGLDSPHGHVNAAAWSGTLRDGSKANARAEVWGAETLGALPPVTPVGRGEAVVLEAALDEALPDGALTAKYAHPAYAAKAAAAKAAASALQADAAAAGTQLGSGRQHALGGAGTAAVVALPAMPADAAGGVGAGLGGGVSKQQQQHGELMAPVSAVGMGAMGAETAESGGGQALANASAIAGWSLTQLSGSEADLRRSSASKPAGVGRTPQQSAAKLLLSSQDMRDDVNLLSMTAKEAARQVAAHCAERARVMLKVDARYQEAFAALHAIVDALHTTNAALVARLDHAHEHAQEQASIITSLEDRVEAHSSECEAKGFKLAELQSAHEVLQWDSEQAIASLTSQNSILAGDVEHFSSRLEEEQAAFHDLLEARMAASTAQVASLTDERDDLHERLRFLEKQNALIRQENSRVPLISHTAMQTDPVDWASAAQEGEAGEDDGSASQVHVGGLDWLPTDAALARLHGKGGASASRRRRRPRQLGGFAGMLTVDKPGRVRSPMWTASTIAQIYQDKTIHDVVCDRENNPRTQLCTYTHEWHITRYGLRHLADANLLDLIASVRHHLKTSARIGWFAQFTGLDDSTDPMDSSQHLSFYLFVLQQLMWPASLQTAFTESPGAEGAPLVAGAPSDVPVLIRGQQAIDATKAIFRYLNDPDAAPGFVARHVEPAPVIASLLPPDSAHHHALGGGAGPAGGGGQAGAAGGPDAKAAGPNNYLVPLDPLVKAFMAEYHKRIDKNIAHLRALFKAGDVDRDGFINYDEFVTLLRLAAPDITERLMTKAYTEAVRDQPPGWYLVSCATFVHVARAFGFDRWKADASGFVSQLPGMGPVGGAALLAEGGVPALLSARKASSRPESSHSQHNLPPLPRQQQTQTQMQTQQQQQQQQQQQPASLSPSERRPLSPATLLHGIERFDTERGLRACVEACLVGMRPSLDELMADARIRLRSPAHPALQHLERQWQHFQLALSIMRGQAPPYEPPAQPPHPAHAQGPQGVPLSAQHPTPGSSNTRPVTTATSMAGAPRPVSSRVPPPVNAAHAWLCLRLLYDGLAAICSRPVTSSNNPNNNPNNNNPNSLLMGSGGSRHGSSGSCSPRVSASASAMLSPRSGSPSTGQRQRMLVVPAMPWRTGAVSPALPPPSPGPPLNAPSLPTTHHLSGPGAVSSSSNGSAQPLPSPRTPTAATLARGSHSQPLRSLNTGQPLLVPLGRQGSADEMAGFPLAPGYQQQQQQQQQQQEQQEVSTPAVFSQHQERAAAQAVQQQQQQQGSAHALRAEAAARQQQEQRQLQEMARTLRASAQQQQQQYRAVPPQVMQLDGHRQRQQQQSLAPLQPVQQWQQANSAGNEFEFRL